MQQAQFYPSFHHALDQGMLEQQPPSLSPFHVPVQHLGPPPPQHHMAAAQYAMSMPEPLPRAKGQRRGVRRNPEAPKRPMSPYVTFVKEKWKSVHTSLPGAAAKDVMRTLGEQWNALPEAEKEKWKQLSDEDKARYATEMQSFDGPSTVAVQRRGGPDGGRRRRSKKDPNAPKRGASAFLLFANEKRKALKDANPTLHNTEISRMLGAIWKAADDATKKPYVEAEAEARRRYGKAMEEYRSQAGRPEPQQDHHHLDAHHHLADVVAHHHPHFDQHQLIKDEQYHPHFQEHHLAPEQQHHLVHHLDPAEHHLAAQRLVEQHHHLAAAGIYDPANAPGSAFAPHAVMPRP